MDKIHICLDLLVSAGKVTAEKTLKETYEKVIGVYNLERDDPKMWEMIWEHRVLSLFQMEEQSGVQGIALVKPKSVDELAVLNSVIRLMAQGKGEEQPLDKFARFKNNINLWYKEMDSYGLTKKEQELLKNIVGSSYGICESQEKFMQLVQIPECGGFDLGWSDRLRKSIAKKNPAEYEKLTGEYFENCKKKRLSQNLCNYVWNVLVAMSRGYGFNASHTLAYSIVGLQEMNLAYKFPVIYWNCACLINDSGSLEDNSEEEVVDIFEPESDDLANGVSFVDLPGRKEKIRKTSSTDYKKLAKAIGKVKAAGINIKPVSINKSNFSFVPDEINNAIWFGMKGLLNVSDELVKEIIANRPYGSIKDFYYRIKPKKQSMISLIKSGAFDEFIDNRKFNMAWYIWQVCDKKNNITLQNMPGLIKYQLLPTETEEQKMAYKVYEFNRYLKFLNKEFKKSQIYIIDERAINFLTLINKEDLIHNNDNQIYIVVKTWDKVYQSYMDIFRVWIAENKPQILQDLNAKIFKEDWENYAGGSISSWEMKVMCFYYHPHELINVNKQKYGLVNFFSLPEEPEVEKTFKRGQKTINLYKLHKICGTCIAKDKNKSIVSLLTVDGMVNVKFPRDYFSIFDKQISEMGADGKKHVVESSWFNRGNMIVVNGIRSGENFIPKKYATTPGHQLYRIEKVLENGDLILQDKRYEGENHEKKS